MNTSSRLRILSALVKRFFDKKMPRVLKVSSYAKLNLYLEILDKRPDGYHNLRTVFERISLSDTLTLKEIDNPEIRIISDSKDIPCDSRNLAYKAAEILKEDLGIKNGVEIRLKKIIPVGAGLGGGSSNAASVLLGLNRLWRLGLSRGRLLGYAAKLGSDVSFFIYNCSYAFGVSRGEKIRPLKSWKKRLWHVLVVPKINVPTKEIYQELDKDFAGARGLKADKRAFNLKVGTDPSVCPNINAMLFNRLEEAAFRLYPQVSKVKEVLFKEAGLGSALMSGSGSAVFGLVDSRKEGLRIAKGLNRFKDWKVFVVTTK